MAPVNKKRKAQDEVPVLVVPALEIKKTDVPEYLHSGEFYRALGDEDDESFVVPGDAMKPDASINDSEDLLHLLRSLRFWGVDGNALEVIAFVFEHSETPALKTSLATFEADYPYLYTLRRILRNPEAMRLEIAIEVGDLDMVKYLTHPNIGPTFSLTPKSIGLAAKHGHINLLQYIHDQGIDWTPNLFVEIVKSGNLDCAKYFHQQCGLANQLSSTFYPTMITNDNIDVYIYGLLNGFTHTHDNSGWIDVLIAGGLKRLKYFHAQNVPFPAGLTYDCAKHGYIDMLKYLSANGVALDSRACASAAQFNQYKTLKFLHENGAPWDEHVTTSAAAEGNLSCLKYAHENGCPWDRETTVYAAIANSLPCLKYAHEKGCPWDSACYRRNLSADCLEYLVKHKCPKD